jgi:hypothetical protein
MRTNLLAPSLLAGFLLACGQQPTLSPPPTPPAPQPDAAAAPPPLPDAAPVAVEPDAPPAPPLPVEGTACDDGDACTLDDKWAGKRCLGRLSETCGPRVEEWGTYTSVQASDGHALGGLHHEDERLPSWVHRRDLGASDYYLEQLPEEPLQQLETPVLYFWSPVARPVKVTVGFPRGIVGQWFPQAETYLPALREMKALAGGSMTWSLTLDPAMDPATFPPVQAEEIWAPSRNVASTPVRFAVPGGGEEREQFIFYRGLGKFEPPIRIVASDELLRITNTSAETPRQAFVLRVSNQRGRIEKLGPLEPGASKMVAIPQATDDLDSYVASARALLAEALVESGLHADVAQAMVDTWSRSWFRNTGLRVLYLTPRAWTDAWLPTTITPEPAAFVRTLVGRIEVLTPQEERDLVDLVRRQMRAQTYLEVSLLGRFAEPRLVRTLELLAEPAEREYARSLLLVAHQQK